MLPFKAAASSVPFVLVRLRCTMFASTVREHPLWSLLEARDYSPCPSSSPQIRSTACAFGRALPARRAMETLGIELVEVEAGVVTLEMAHDPRLTQQHRLHARWSRLRLPSTVLAAMPRYP